MQKRIVDKTRKRPIAIGARSTLLRILLILLLSGLANLLYAQSPAGLNRSILDGHSIDYKVGFLGNPSSWNMYELTVPVPWTEETVGQLKKFGFNTIQINLAWGTRPGDEALNLEDIVKLTPEQDKQFPQIVPLMSKPGEAAYEKRRAELHNRIVLCHKAGLRTIFHFGAPYNARDRYGNNPPNCIMDSQVIKRYILLLKAFGRDFPGVDDILVYNNDQGAWLCSEFGECPRCKGIPLPDRTAPFLDSLTACWQSISPKGRLWWEPWGFSAGQALTTVEKINPKGFGIAIHCTIAEVLATLPVDRWVKNMATIARERNIPTIVEYWLGSPSEELETFFHFPYPLVTFRGLKAIAGVQGVVGIKEYYGLNPTCEDPNLRMTGIFFKNPRITESAALRELAKPYGRAAGDISEMWRQTSEGMEIFPWNLTWQLRRFGTKGTIHSLSPAIINGFGGAGTYLKTDYSPSDPGLFEDAQLRFQLAAERWAKAFTIGDKCKRLVPKSLAADYKKQLTDIGDIKRRALSFAYHLRETNMVSDIRSTAALKRPIGDKIDKLRELLNTDLENHNEKRAVKGKKNVHEWKEMEQAIALLDKDQELFFKTYF